MENITIAIAKGRLCEKSLKLFENSEMEVVWEENSRKLIFTDAVEKTKYILVKPSDVVAYVESGVADLGIVGRDVILEENKEVYEIMDLNFGKCRFVIAGFKEYHNIVKGEVLRVATKYPNYVKTIFNNRIQPIEIIKLNGSIELAPLMEISDVIVDIVETGNTLRDNGLEILEELDYISTRLIANKVSYRFKYETIKKIEKILGGE